MVSAKHFSVIAFVPAKLSIEHRTELIEFAHARHFNPTLLKHLFQGFGVQHAVGPLLYLRLITLRKT